MTKHTTKRIRSTCGDSRGFALLYTVVVISLILSIAISISNTSFKQGILSNLAKDSQIAFYQADAGAECGLYRDIVGLQFPFGVTALSAPASVDCGSVTLDLASGSTDGYLIYEESGAADSEPCFSFVIDKTDPGAVTTILEARGHNRCGAGSRQVERAVRLIY